MKYKLFLIAAILFPIGLIGCMSGQYAANYEYHSSPEVTLRMMKMQDVIDMSKAGVSDSLIIATMDATNSWFKLSPQDVINLKNAGVSEKVINAMMVQPAESTGQTKETKIVRYYYYPDDWWYDGFYQYWWYSPAFTIRTGHPFYRHGYAFHRRAH
jgi:hypothetical protein